MAREMLEHVCSCGPSAAVSFWTIAAWGAVPAAVAAGAGIAAWAATHPSAQLFGRTIRRLPQDPGVGRLALTFDDGPNPAVTPQLLDLLDRYQVPATFFLVGRFVRMCPELTREIANRGHMLGNHTDTHPNLIWLSPGRITGELERCQGSVGEAVGHVPRWMRPPYGFRGPQLDTVVRRVGLRGVVMWSVIAYDWKPQPVSQLIERLKRVRSGDIVVLHDGNYRVLNGDRQHVVGALEFWLPRWRDTGLEFVTMDAFDSGAAKSRPTPR